MPSVGAQKTIQLYDHLGNPKKEGDAPLGIGYDEDGVPHPDWEIEQDATADNPDANGRGAAASALFLRTRASGSGYFSPSVS